MFKYISKLLRPNKQNIYELVFPFYLLSRILNITHFSIVGELTDGQIKITVRNKIQYFIAVTTIGVLFYYFAIQPNNYTNVKFIDTGNYVFILISILYIDVVILLSSKNAKYYWSIFETTHMVDCRMNFLHFPVNHNHQFVQLTKYLIYEFCVLFGFIGYTFFHTNLTTLQTLYQIVPGFWYVCIMELYASILYLIRARFVQLNKCFRYYFLDTSTETFKKTLNVNRQTILKDVSEMYESLCNINDRVNKAIGIQIMICFVVYMLYTGFAIFAMYLILFHHDPELILNSLIFNIIFVFAYTFYFILIITFSEMVMTESKTLTSLVHSALREQSAVLIQNQINYFYFIQQMIHRQPIPSCSLFNFNWPLVYSVIGSICSYLIILIQFDNPNLLNIK